MKSGYDIFGAVWLWFWITTRSTDDNLCFKIQLWRSADFMFENDKDLMCQEDFKFAIVNIIKL